MKSKTLELIENEKQNRLIEFLEKIGPDKGTATQLANFVVFLRLTDNKDLLSDTGLCYALRAYLGIDFDTASKSVNEALGL